MYADDSPSLPLVLSSRPTKPTTYQPLESHTHRMDRCCPPPQAPTAAPPPLYPGQRRDPQKPRLCPYVSPVRSPRRSQSDRLALLSLLSDPGSGEDTDLGQTLSGTATQVHTPLWTTRQVPAVPPRFWSHPRAVARPPACRSLYLQSLTWPPHARLTLKHATHSRRADGPLLPA